MHQQSDLFEHASHPRIVAAGKQTPIEPLYQPSQFTIQMLAGQSSMQKKINPIIIQANGPSNGVSSGALLLNQNSDSDLLYVQLQGSQGGNLNHPSNKTQKIQLSGSKENKGK